MRYPESFPDFVWASGEECSDPLVLHEGSVVRVDELDSTGHLANRGTDLAQAASLGIGAWRYGMPWHRTEVSPGEYDWKLWDEALAGCEEHGLTPIIDLCHFGLPDHYGGFCDPSWVDGFLRYVEAFLSRYSEPRWFTPVNEPSVTAAESALFGIWNDRRTSLRDFAIALSHCVLADLEAFALISADRDAWNVCAEAFIVPVVTVESRRADANTFTAHWVAAWDLRLGHALDPTAEATFGAVDDNVRSRIDALATTDRIIAGHDFYPTSVTVYGPPGDEPPNLTISERTDAYEAAARAFHERYATPFWVAETSNLGLPAAQGSEWLQELTARLARLRSDDIPARGLCWYSRGDQHDWDNALATPVQAVTEVGLFDLNGDERPVAQAFRSLATTTP